jgi:UDPglucose 6-dehydrogenase
MSLNKLIQIGVIGIGVVGSAVYNGLIHKGFIENATIFPYDKFKNNGIGSIENIFNCDIVFLCLPTPFDNHIHQYDKTCIEEVCCILNNNKFKGIVLIKSTVEPETTYSLEDSYPYLNIIHNPEFLIARFALIDFINQDYIVIGKGKNCSTNALHIVVDFYKTHFNTSSISICSALESESAKLFINSFGATKVQFFNELYQLCNKNGCDYETVRKIMIQNKWVNDMHTQVPGPDGQLSYGGMCFPKDTNALNEYMKKYNSMNAIIDATINERNTMRNDN